MVEEKEGVSRKEEKYSKGGNQKLHGHSVRSSTPVETTTV
jgi:hypothetical protein